MRKITSKLIKKLSNLFYCIIYGCWFYRLYNEKKNQILYFDTLIINKMLVKVKAKTLIHYQSSSSVAKRLKQKISKLGM